MIVFRYTKNNGGEFISHLDLLRHVDRTLRRAGIEVKKSEAVNKHPRIYLSNPLGVGIASTAEYCTVDTDYAGDFKEAFNAHSPEGIKCVEYKYTEKNINVANSVTANDFLVQGIAPFDVNEIMGASELVLTDKRDRTKDVRPSILALVWQEDGLLMTLQTGQNNLRPDVLGEYLASRFGGEVGLITKTKAYGLEAYGL